MYFDRAPPYTPTTYLYYSLMGHSIYREVVVYYVLIDATRKRAASKKMVGSTQRTTTTTTTKGTRAVPIVIVCSAR